MKSATKEKMRLHSKFEAMAQRLIKNLKVGVYSCNAQGRLSYVNDAFLHILGFKDSNDVLGLRIEDVLYPGCEDKEHYLRNMQLKGSLRDYDWKHKRPDGVTVYLNIYTDYIYDEAGHPIGSEGVLYDFTKRKLSEQKNDIFQKAIEQSADHVLVTDIQGRIHYVNAAFEKTTGYRKEEIIGKNPRILKSNLHDDEFYQTLWNTILSGNVFRSPITNKKKNGALFVADQSISPVKNENGEIAYFISIWKNITDRVEKQQQIKKEMVKLEEIVGFDEKVSRIRKFDVLIDYVVKKTVNILEAEKCLLMLCDRCTDKLYIKGVCGITEDDVKDLHINVGEPISGLVVKNVRPIIVQAKGGKYGKFKGIKEEFLGRSIISVPLKLHDHVLGVITVAEKKNGGTNGFDNIDLKLLTEIAAEVTVALENVRLYKKLKYLSVTDPLTKLYNFRYFIRTMEQEIKRMKRFPKKLSLMMMDVDRFKAYNDTFGHSAGDKCLKKVAQILQQCLREIDICCRYAGDEFVVILPETDKLGAKQAAQKIQKALSNVHLKRKIALSIGIAEYSKGMSRIELTNMADKAMYKAKQNKKEKICLFG